MPNFDAESKPENLELVKLWDAKGLAKVFSSPHQPGHYSRVFNAHKSSTLDRQIGDRRLPNQRERHLDGPSRHLPPGPLLTNLWLPRYSHCLYGSITDRRDFYHQACVSDSRARSNLLPFGFSRDELAGLAALDDFNSKVLPKKTRAREVVGDDLGPGGGDGLQSTDHYYVGFASLFQGDHLGVEYALEPHQNLLISEGLVSDKRRIKGHCSFPDSGRWEALVSDDYFCIGAELLSAPPLTSFASNALAQARQAYDKHQLEGSPEKDIINESSWCGG